MEKQAEKIMVVESDPIVADVIARQALGGQGFEIKCVAEAAEAIRQAVSFQPDLVIADLELPGLTGKDLIAALNFQNQTVPVIVISSKGREKDVIRAFRLGAVDFISQPIREAEVVSAAERALQAVRARKERERLGERLQQANQELKTRVEQLTTLFAIGKVVTSVPDPKKLFQKIVEQAVSITQADFGWFLNLDEYSGEFLLRAQLNLPNSLQQHMNKPWDDGISSLVARSGQPFSIHGEAMERFMLYSLGKSALVVPVQARDQIIGLLVVMRKRDREFNAAEQAMLEGMGDYAAISLINARLFQALDERANSLQATVDQTQHEKRMNDQMIFLVNQELRTSLAGVIGTLNQLLKAEKNNQSFAQASSLHLVEESIGQFTEISETMKFLQDANTNANDAKIDLIDVAQAAVKKYSEIARHEGINIDVQFTEPTAIVFGNSTRISMVLDALVSNTINISRKNSQVIIRIDPPENGQINVTVGNDGIEPSQFNLERIFSPFARRDDPSDKLFRGLEIELALIKEVVEAHGGQVWIESKAKKGLVFHFSLPESG